MAVCLVRRSRRGRSAGVFGSCALLLVALTSRFAQAQGDPRFNANANRARPASEVTSDDAPEAPAPLSLTELEQRFIDVRAPALPPPVRLTLGFGMIYPYQAFGGGIGVEWFALPALRLSFMYSAGATFANGNDEELHGSFSNYGEASFAVRVFGIHSPIVQNLSVREGGAPERMDVPAAVPVYQAVFVEAGFLTGLLPWGRCIADCQLSDITQQTLALNQSQVWLPFAGLRYIYYYDVGSKPVQMRRRAFAEVYGQVIVAPWDPLPAGDLAWSGRALQRSALGERAGVDFTLHSPSHYDSLVSRFGIAMGYTPLPGSFYLAFSVGFEGG